MNTARLLAKQAERAAELARVKSARASCSALAGCDLSMWPLEDLAVEARELEIIRSLADSIGAVTLADRARPEARLDPPISDC